MGHQGPRWASKEQARPMGVSSPDALVAIRSLIASLKPCKLVQDPLPRAMTPCGVEACRSSVASQQTFILFSFLRNPREGCTHHYPPQPLGPNFVIVPICVFDCCFVVAMCVCVFRVFVVYEIWISIDLIFIQTLLLFRCLRLLRIYLLVRFMCLVLYCFVVCII